MFLLTRHLKPPEKEKNDTSGGFRLDLAAPCSIQVLQGRIFMI